MKMHMLGLGQPKYVPPLNSAMALQTGSDLLGELLIFSTCVFLLVIEFSRQSRKNTRKHNQHKEERLQLKEKLLQLNDRVARQSKDMKDLKLRLSDLYSRKHGDS